VMELVEGETLSARLRQGPLPIEVVLRFAGHIAAALAAAHAKGITHRDLKPGNIVIGRSGLKVLDFGLAKFTRSARPLAESGPTMTMTQQVVGTLPYMAPEQLEGKECDARTDVFAAGLVICEMATGKRVFGGASQAAIAAEVMRGEVPPMAGVPPSLARAIRGCLAREPDDRWQTARELQIVLGATAAGIDAAVPVRRLARSERVAWAAAAVMTLVTAALVMTLAGRAPPSAAKASFEVRPPEGGAFASASQPVSDVMAVSPDGLRLAYSATVEGRRLLWIRAISSLTAQPVPGTDGAYSSFWSPDSR